MKTELPIYLIFCLHFHLILYFGLKSTRNFNKIHSFFHLNYLYCLFCTDIDYSDQFNFKELLIMLL